MSATFRWTCPMSTRGSMLAMRPTIPPRLAAGVADELLAARVALNLLRQHRPDLADVELLLDDLGLERRRVLSLERASEVAERDADRLVEAEHLGPVLGLAGVVLLPVGHADLRFGGQQDARQRSVDARLPAPAWPAGLPSSNSVVSSPKYQRLPSSSCAYQSNVSSTGTPFSVTRSWTTR